MAKGSKTNIKRSINTFTTLAIGYPVKSAIYFKGPTSAETSLLAVISRLLIVYAPIESDNVAFLALIPSISFDNFCISFVAFCISALTLSLAALPFALSSLDSCVERRLVNWSRRLFLVVIIFSLSLMSFWNSSFFLSNKPT